MGKRLDRGRSRKKYGNRFYRNGRLIFMRFNPSVKKWLKKKIHRCYWKYRVEGVRLQMFCYIQFVSSTLPCTSVDRDHHQTSTEQMLFVGWIISSTAVTLAWFCGCVWHWEECIRCSIGVWCLCFCCCCCFLNNSVSLLCWVKSKTKNIQPKQCCDHKPAPMEDE